MNLTQEQRAAIDSAGKTIVSASAGSGKTFVMIRKLVAAIRDGVDLDNVLAVTFTKKAAAQMKDKLRSAIIDAMDAADADGKAKLKLQLSKVSSASISTIHSFCAKLLRTYFYAVGIDGTFDIISADDAFAKQFKNRAVENLFERYYAEDNPCFKTLLRCYRKKRGDGYLKNLILSSYEKLRINAGYIDLLNAVVGVYTQEGFDRICKQLENIASEKYLSLKKAVDDFAKDFKAPRPEYGKILEEMRSSLNIAARTGIFDPLPPLTLTRKPTDRTDEDKAAGEVFKKFKDGVSTKYKDVRGDIGGEADEREYFLKSGEAAIAFAEVLKHFDAEYTAIKRDENKLDYNDLEHLTLALLQDETIRNEINDRYTCVFVDEYQDVNPVQEEIISRVGGKNVFLVGDVKQAIYGFRGSKSLFFAEKYNRFEGGVGNALRLSNNFRSSDGVLGFVNPLFSGIMTGASCGFEYSGGSVMIRGGGYPEGYGSSQIHIFGKDEEEKAEPEIYSVKSGGKAVRHSREGRAVLEIVKRELNGKHYDLKTGAYVDTQMGDICILTRKRNKSAAGIVRALTDAGYPVSGAQEPNVLSRPEVKQVLDILSYLDNGLQDIPLASALLSPLGGLSCSELAAVRIASKGSGRISFRECCKKYSERMNDGISEKLNRFYGKTHNLRTLAEVLSAAEMIDKILEDTGLEAVFSADGGEKLKNVRRLAAEGEGISVSALLAKLKDGYEIQSPSAASSESIKIMTMHASKGLEFPVVIIADICATYKGKEQSELPFDGEYGFAPKYFDGENMLTHTTVLRRLAAERGGREELKNELNLFYVACTRAMCNLHLMAQEQTEYNPLDASDASAYSKLFDMSAYSPEIMPELADEPKQQRVTILPEPDAEFEKKIEERFMREYARANSVNLPVKSSASAILRLSAEDAPFRTHELFSGEGETGTERGTAYHRFLELCDFAIKDRQGICAELDSFVVSGRISAEQRKLLDEDDLSEILNMPVFSKLGGATLFREQEFLCRLPADSILDTDADDGILVQGAIDLLAQTEDGFKIIDYKYSHKTDEQLIQTYSRQLALYKKAVALIMHVDEGSIDTAIVNIFSKRQIQL